MSIEKLREIAAKRTKGAWKLERYKTVDGVGDYDYFGSDQAPEMWKGGPRKIMSHINSQYANDRGFIVAFANCADEILDVLEASDKACDRVAHTFSCQNSISRKCICDAYVLTNAVEKLRKKVGGM